MPTSLYHIAHQPAKRARLLDLRTSLGLSGGCEQQVPVRTNKHIIIIIIQNQQVAFPCAQQQYRPQWSYCYIVVVFNQFEVAGQSPPPPPTPSTLIPRNKKPLSFFLFYFISHINSKGSLPFMLKHRIQQIRSHTTPKTPSPPPLPPHRDHS